MASLSLSKSILMLFLLISATISSQAIEEPTCIYPDLAGNHHIKFFYIYKHLNEVSKTQKAGTPLPKNGLKNRLLLHGAPGNGKTTMARAIAKESKCHSIYVNGPEFMDEHIGQGAKNIKRTFNSAQEHADLHKENVVIIIDEIDAFAGNVDSPERSEHKATLQELWHQLDLIQDDPRIFFVGMTNAEEIDGALKSRFGNNIIKLESPDAKMRKAVLQFYKTKHTGKPWDNTLLQKLVDRSKFQTISIRFLQDYTEEVIQIAKNQTENVITQELAFKVFDEMKAKYVQGWIPYLWNGTCKYSLKTLNAAAALRILWPVPIPVPTPVPVPA